MFHFYAMLSRMKYINRWGLMRNTRSENICEHSLDTAVIAHALAMLRNTCFGGSVNAERAAVLAMFHDATEILTGDLPTPVKYDNPEIRTAYGRVEEMAQQRLLALLPQDLQSAYRPLLCQSEPDDAMLFPLVKAADKISALIKCVEERSMGNAEFRRAEQAQREAILAMNLPEAECFLMEFLPSYELTLDEQDLPDQPQAGAAGQSE